MARVPASTPGRGITTYKRGKTTSRRSGSTLKKKIINPSPISKYTKVSSVTKRGRPIAEANSDSDDTGSSDESGSEEKENDDVDVGEEEEFDPNLRNLVHQCKSLCLLVMSACTDVEPVIRKLV